MSVTNVTHELTLQSIDQSLKRIIVLLELLVLRGASNQDSKRPS